MGRQRQMVFGRRPPAVSATESNLVEAAAPPSGGQPLPPQTREALEPSFGHSFADVRVFENAASGAVAQSIGAVAVAADETITFAPGHYQPDSPRGRHLLAHELAHLVQQRGAATAESGPQTGTREQEARAAADAALIGAPATIAAGPTGVGRMAAQDEASKETEAQRAERIVGQFPWMANMFPGWAFTVGPSGVKATKTDGMTTLTRSADVNVAGGFGVEVGQRRVTEADKDHSMESGKKAGWGDGAGYFEWMSGGKWLADDGTKRADQTTQKLMVGTDTIGGQSTISKTEDTVTKTRTTEASLKDGKVSVGVTTGREFKLDDDHKLSSSTAIKAGSEEVSIGRTTGSRIKDAETGAVASDQTKTSVGWTKDKGLSAQYGKDQTTEIDGQKFTSGTTGGVSTKGVELTSTKGHTSTGDDGKEATSSNSRGVTIGFDGSASYKVSSTDAKGNTTAGSIGGSLDPSNLGVNASVSRNGWTVSAKAGMQVMASEPRQVGDRWLVDWAKVLSATGGGSGKGVGVSGGFSSTDSGTRAFKSQAEAQAFKENAASLLPSTSHDPTTVDGAMYLEIGESRGSGVSAQGGVNASVSPTGGSIGVGASTKSSSNVRVTRLSATVFELTYSEGESESLSLSASTLGIGATRHSTDKSGANRTVRVDLSSANGKTAFETFTKQGGMVAPGARVISQSQMKGHESGQNFGGPGFDHDRTGFVEEEVTQDAKGRTERYTGGTRDEFESRIPWSKSHSKMSVQLDQTETNDRDSTYAVRGKVDATEGRASFQHLANITGTVTRDASKAKSSGKWGVEVELTEGIVNAFIESIGKEKIRAIGIFDGADARNELRQRLRDAKTSDDRKRALASFFADAGYEGNAIEAIRQELYGSGDRFHLVPYEQMKRQPGQNFHYDLTLPNDANFKGIGARKELEAKIDGFDAAIKQNPAAAGSLHGPILETLNEVRRQRSEIADPKRYTDLPDELRENQVARLDLYIGRLAGQAQQAGTAFTAHDQAAVEAEISQGPKGAQPTGLALIRKEMGITDKTLGFDKASCQEAEGKFMELQRRALRGHGDLPKDLSAGLMTANKTFVEAKHLREAAEALEPDVNRLRSQYVEAMKDPKSAEAAGVAALGQLTKTEKAWGAATEKLWQAEGELRYAVEEFR